MHYLNAIKAYIKKIFYVIYDIIFQLYIKNKKIQYGLNNTENRKEKIIISLTTYPARINVVYLTIKSILSQTIKPDKVILYLGDDSKNIQLPNSLIQLQKYGLSIEYRNDNLKSHKKYYYVMKEYPNDLIITIDDDLLYHKNFIKKLYNFHKKFPLCVCAYRVHKMKFYKKNLLPYRNWDFEYTKIKEPSHQLFLTTGAGALFPPNSLPPSAFDKDNIKYLCPNADDVWINIMLIVNRKKVIWVPSKRQMPPTIIQVQKNGLNNSNIDYGGNDIQLNNLLKFYNINLYERIY